MPLSEWFLEAADAEARMSITLPGPIGRLLLETPLQKLTDLYESGILTQSEFDAARRRLLARDAVAPVPANLTPIPDAACSPATKS